MGDAILRHLLFVTDLSFTRIFRCPRGVVVVVVGLVRSSNAVVAEFRSWMEQYKLGSADKCLNASIR